MFPSYCLSLVGTLLYYISEYLVHIVFRERNLSSNESYCDTHRCYYRTNNEQNGAGGTRKCAIIALLDWLRGHTGLFNNSLLPLLDSFTVSLLDTCSIPLCAKMKKVPTGEQRVSTGEKEYGNKLKGFMWQSQKIRWLYFLRN